MIHAVTKLEDKFLNILENKLMTMADLKLVLAGDGCCGKSSIVQILVDGKLADEYVPSVMDNYFHDIEINGKHITIDIRDNSGLEDYERLRLLTYSNTNAFIMCFSIISPESLKDIPKYWIPEVRSVCPNTPFILVGIKKDLRNDPQTIAELARKNHEPVKYEEGKATAKKIGAFAYVECSAVNKEGVHEVFEKATQLSLKMKKKQSCSII